MDELEQRPEDDGSVVVVDEPFDPMSIRDPLPQPLFSARRLATVGLVLLAVLCVVAAVRSGGGAAESGDGTAIVAFEPRPGGRVVRQSEVGVVLEEGWDGRLTIEGVAIPEEEMVGAVDPESPEYDPEAGPRPNTKSLVQYQPGPGKTLTEFDTGAIEIAVRYWRIDDRQATEATYTFSINVF